MGCAKMFEKLIDKYYLNALCVVLLGYALFNRGFAYIGVPPLFVGEILLLAGLGLWLSCPYVTPLSAMASPWILLLTMGWVGLRTVPYLKQYRFDAIRDAMIVGYGVFAFLIFGMLVAKPSRLLFLLHRYRLFCYIFLLSMPIVRGIVTLVGGEELFPRHPGTVVPIVCVRQGPMMIHLAGITAFLAAQRASWFWFGLIALNFLLAISNRGGFLAFFSACSLLVLLRPGSHGVSKFVAYMVFGVVLLGLSRFEVEIDTAGAIKQNRKLSFDGLVGQLKSIAGSSRQSNFDDTKRWRLEWWGKIVDYTVNGKYFVGGKGFGVNLADDDGFQTEHASEDKAPNRSPHNSHLTLLARGGVPAFVLWGMLQFSWGLGVLGHYCVAARRNDGPWASLFLFLLALWLANLVETTFDVYLESPMGGIWFWTLFGVGWAANLIYRYHPEVLLRQNPVPASAPRTGTALEATSPIGPAPFSRWR